jgi:CRISPR-associated protein Cmr3
MPSIRIEAIDTLFFRDGRPFSMGEETFATGIFPPPPSVFYGALRSAYASKNKISINDIKAKTKDITITDIAFNVAEKLYFPMPLDLVQLKLANEGQAKLLQISNTENFVSSLPTDFKYILWRPEHVQNVSNGMIDFDSLQAYLNGTKSQTETWNYLTIDSLTTTEIKMGIGRNNETRQTEDGQLYRIGMKRLQSFNNQDINKRLSFVITTNENKLSTFGKLGAESKGVSMTEVEQNINPSVTYSNGKYFKIYLQTPAFFSKGAIPDLEKHFPDWDLEILTCVVGRPLPIGGFDMDIRQPKTMMKATPAGSVFYIKINNEADLQQFVKTFADKKSLSDYRSEEGFGLFRIANLDFNM